MLRLADKRLSAYKGKYEPVELYKNNKKIFGYKISGMPGSNSNFSNTYNTPMLAYGKSGYVQGKNLCQPVTNLTGSYEDGEKTYNWDISVKENGRFNLSGAMVTGVQISNAILAAGTYTASGCQLVSLWWDGIEDFLPIPNTFTLTQDTEVSCVLWYTSTEEISLNDQYIQIEKGSRATYYQIAAGNQDFPPSIDNKRRLEASEGSLVVSGSGGPDNITNFIDIPMLAGLEVPVSSPYNYSEESGSNTYYFIADSLSGNQLKRNIGKLKFSGEENFFQKEIQSTTHNCYYCDLSHLIKRNRSADVCLCNCFEAKDEFNTSQTGIVLGQNDTNLYFIVEKNRFSNLNAFVRWIANQYNSLPLTVHYILDSEISEKWDETPFVSFPHQTQIYISYKTNYPRLGLTKCIKIKDF